MPYVGGALSDSYIGPSLGGGGGGGGATGGGDDKVFYENDQAITTDYTVSATTNAMSAGPISIADGLTITVEAGGRWVVV